MHFGYDISSNNAGLNQDSFNRLYQLAFAAGGGARPFMIVKLNQGTGYVNPTAAPYVAMARSAGFAVAGYLMDEGPADPGSEVHLFNTILQLPMADDIELPEGLSTSDYIRHSAALIAVDPNALVYLNQSQVQQGFPQGWGLWLAQYNNNPGNTIVPTDMHQYRSDLSVVGVPSLFDANAWTGTEDRFNIFFQLSVPPPPPTPPPSSEVPMQSEEVGPYMGQLHQVHIDNQTHAITHHWRNAGLITVPGNGWNHEDFGTADGKMNGFVGSPVLRIGHGYTDDPNGILIVTCTAYLGQLMEKWFDPSKASLGIGAWSAWNAK